MSSFIVALIIFLIIWGCDSVKERARIAELKENKTNLPLQISIERKIFNQMIPDYKEEYKKMYEKDISENLYYNDKKILDILAIKYKIPTREELKTMHRSTMFCDSLVDLANLYAECQVAKMGHKAVTRRCWGRINTRKEPYTEDELNNVPQTQYKTAYEQAKEDMKKTSDIDKKYPGLF